MLKFRTPQGEGRAPARGHRGQPHPAPGPAARGAAPAAPARASGRRRPPPRRSRRRAAPPCACHLAGRELASLRSRLDDARGAHGPSSRHEESRAEGQAGRARHAGHGHRGAAVGHGRRRPGRRAGAVRVAARAGPRARPRCSPSGGAASSATGRAFVDQAVIATLEAESARLPAELAEVEAEARGARRPRSPSWPRPSAALAASASAFETDWADGVAAPSGAGRRGAGRAGGAARGRRARRRRDGAGAGPARRAHREGGAPGRARPTGCAPSWRRPSSPSCRWSSRSTAPSSGGPTAEAALAEAEDAHRAAEADRHAWRGPRRGARPGARRGPRRAPAPSGWPASTACSARCSTSSRSTPGRRRRSRPPPARRWPRSWSTDVDAGRRALAALHAEAICRARCWPLGAPQRRRAPPPPVGEPLRRHVRCAPARASTQLLDALRRRRPSWSTGGWAAAVDVALAHPGRRGRHPRRRPLRRSPAGGSAAGGSGATGAALDEARAAGGRSGRRRRQARRRRLADGRASGSTRPAGPRTTWPAARRATTAGSARPATGSSGSRPSGATPPPRPSRCRRHLDELAERVARERARIAELEADAARRSRPTRRQTARARPGAWARPGPGSRSGRPRSAPCAPTSRCAVAGVDERRRVPAAPPRPRSRSGSTRRSRGAGRGRAAPARARRRQLVAADRLAALRRRAPRPWSRPSWPTCASAAAGSPRRPARWPPSSTAAASERVEAEQQLEEVRERLQRVEIDDAETKLRHRDRGRGPAPRPRLRARRGHGRRVPAAGRGRHAGRPGPRARARAADHGPDQPARPRGVRGAAGAPRVPAAAARRRQGVTPRAGQDHQGHRRARSSTCSPRPTPTWPQNFEHAVRDAVPGRQGPAAAHRARQPARHRHRGRGQAVGQERAASCRCCRVASGRSPRWRSCSPCSAAARRRST